MLLKFNVARLLVLCIALLGVLAPPATSTSPAAKSSCESQCGNFTIEYPFGIGSTNCFYNEWFEILCYNERPHLRIRQGILQANEVLDIDQASNRISIRSNTSNNRVCADTSDLFAYNLKGSPYFFSPRNKFMLVGCGNAILSDGKRPRYGCTSVCDQRRSIGDCYGINCCEDNIFNQTDNRSFTEYYLNFSNSVVGKNSCATAFLVDYKWYPENAPLFLDPSVDLGDVSVPLVLGWTLPDTMPASCIFTRDGCIPGFSDPYTASMLPVAGIPILMLAIVVISTSSVRGRIKGKLKRNKFKQNGGLLLEKYLSSNENILKEVRLFTSKDLSKATDRFNENRILGEGGQGTVYKGMLGDGKIVAIKKSKLLVENKVEEFINEIIILSQIDHRNVVKLFGCCLEMDVPILVYEFISNGTLYNLIHNEHTSFPLSWELRFRISLEVAEALLYLHSATSVPIFHRDIKSNNILLDEKYRVKVADFGISRHTKIDQTHLTTMVKGTFGYLDPEYFRSSQFTDKSDVYSYGVVLVELLTRLKPVSFFEEEQSHLNLATRFLLAIEENCVDDILDPQVKEVSNKEELGFIIKLAQQCLNVNGRNRPNMKEVVMELQSIKKSQIPTTMPSSGTEVMISGITSHPFDHHSTSSDVSP